MNIPTPEQTLAKKEIKDPSLAIYNPNRPTCRHFLKNSCLMGDACRFFHGKSPSDKGTDEPKGISLADLLRPKSSDETLFNQSDSGSQKQNAGFIGEAMLSRTPGKRDQENTRQYETTSPLLDLKFMNSSTEMTPNEPLFQSQELGPPVQFPSTFDLLPNGRLQDSQGSEMSKYPPLLFGKLGSWCDPPSLRSSSPSSNRFERSLVSGDWSSTKDLFAPSSPSIFRKSDWHDRE